MAKGYRWRPSAMPKIAVDMDEHVFQAINEHAAKRGVSWTGVARELLRCAVEDGKLEEYYPDDR